MKKWNKNNIFFIFYLVVFVLEYSLLIFIILSVLN